MHANPVKTLWDERKPVINGWLSIANAFTAEIMAGQGYDSITIDLQHGLAEQQDAVAMMQAMRASRLASFVRIPWLDPASIMKALDAGAYGVICPMINTRRQGLDFVACLRYPPHGLRSFGPTRASISAGANYRDEADSQVIGLAMIETAEGYENLAEIVTTPGLDGVYIGPAGLTLGLTGTRYAPGFDGQEPETIEALKRILMEAHRAGIRAALHCGTPDYAARAISWGFDFVTVSNDVRLLANAAAASLQRTRSLLDITEVEASTSGSRADHD